MNIADFDTSAPEMPTLDDRPELSKDQELALKAISSTEETCVLTGGAGTGKTFLTQEIIKDVEASHGRVMLCALTHKAADVISDATGGEAMTIHSAVGARPRKVDGKSKLVLVGRNKIRELAPTSASLMVIVDESSMLSDEFRQTILQSVEDLENVRFLFVGDKKQVPCVEGECTLFDGNDHPVYELTTVHRQALDNPIIVQASALGSWINNPEGPMPAIYQDVKEQNVGVYHQPHHTMEPLLVQFFENNRAEAMEHKVVAFTNARVRRINKLLRPVIYPEHPIEHFVGENLVANEAVEFRDEIILENNQIVTVDSLSLNQVVECRGVEVYTTQVHTVFGSFHIPQNWDQVNSILKSLASACSRRDVPWKEYYYEKGRFVDLREPWASTIHKAQGSSYKSTWIDLNDIWQCRDEMLRARLLYTALTRSREMTVAFS